MGKYLGGVGGAHNHGPATDFETFLQEELKRRAEWYNRPEEVERRKENRDWAEKQKALREVEKGKLRPHEFYGPPNPYRPHRKWRPPD